MLKLLAPVLLGVILGQAVTGSIPGVTTTQPYKLSATLDNEGNYLLFWAFNDTDITFEVHVRTRGWIGFGMTSSNGQMYPGDVVTGWVKDGVAHFQDRHTVGHVAPVIDSSQDWHLLQGFENDFGTVLTFTRPIDTCDTDGDMIVQEGTVRLIFSYHHDDPTSDDGLMYHGPLHRGSKSISLLSESMVPSKFPTNVKHFDFLNGNFLIPDNSTYYNCRGIQMPDIGTHQMIKYEPIITPGNEGHVHHMVLYRCMGIPASKDGVSVNCYDPLRETKLPYCVNMVLAWAIGGQPIAEMYGESNERQLCTEIEPFYFPDHVGLSVGAPSDSSFYILETHFDNPNMKSGIIDDSGIRITLTTDFRPHEAGVFEVGADISARMVIPPQEPAFKFNAYCSADCIERGFHQSNINEINVFAIFQHSHLLGKAIKTRLFRNGTELAPLINDPNYDFNFQETRALPHERVMKPGDSVTVECIYDSTGRTGMTTGGLSTRDEMCVTFMYYYPRFKLSACISEPNLNNLDGVSYQQAPSYVRTLDWSDPAVRRTIKDKLENTSQKIGCFGAELTPPYGYEIFPKPNVTSPYIPPKPQCST